jgi:hypothetical protein
MPAFLSFETDSVEKMRAFWFDDPWDARRFCCCTWRGKPDGGSPW